MLSPPSSSPGTFFQSPAACTAGTSRRRRTVCAPDAPSSSGLWRRSGRSRFCARVEGLPCSCSVFQRLRGGLRDVQRAVFIGKSFAVDRQAVPASPVTVYGRDAVRAAFACCAPVTANVCGFPLKRYCVFQEVRTIPRLVPDSCVFRVAALRSRHRAVTGILCCLCCHLSLLTFRARSAGGVSQGGTPSGYLALVVNRQQYRVNARPCACKRVRRQWLPDPAAILCQRL